MLSIFLKEINTFFSSLIGYVVIGVFLLVTGLFIWVLPDYNVLDYGYASLEQLFTLAPWIFLFLIPAITMRTFSEEKQIGTIEMLLTKPIKDWEIILGKFFACLVLVVIAILPTLIYFYSIYQLGNPVGNIDTGATWGAYLGLFFLGGCFVSMGICASSFTKNQVVAFLLGAMMCFCAYWLFYYISKMSFFYGTTDDLVQSIGIDAHYNSISRGVVDLRDLIYFLSFVAFFLSITFYSLRNNR